MGTWMLYVTFATLLAVTAAQSCQRDWLNAEFVVTSVGYQDVDLLTATSLGFDPTFLTSEMSYSSQTKKQTASFKMP